MKVLFLSYEVAPVYKFGGLGDVAYALPKALSKLGIDVRVGMPAYAGITKIDFLPDTNVALIFAEDALYRAEGIVGVHKNPINRAQAFAYFAKDILQTVKKSGWVPDIIHLNDWHTGLVAWWLKVHPDDYFAHTKILFTAHNTRHNGSFPIFYLLSEPKTRDMGQLLQKNNRKTFSFLRRSIVFSDWVSTVSEHFCFEIKHHRFGFGVGKELRSRGERFVGILNGIDYDIWNAHSDPYIAQKFTSATVSEGKAANKLWLQKKVGLPTQAEIPLLSMVARLAWQKGFDITVPVLRKLLLGKAKMQIVFLGEGDALIGKKVKQLADDFPQQVKFFNTYSEELAHQLYAGSDFFLVPSIYEPCGLTQMISMEYATIPISSAVGGLADTVVDGQSGFVFHGHNKLALERTIKRALEAWQDAQKIDGLRRHILEEDFSSRKSAQVYQQLYKRIRES